MGPVVHHRAVKPACLAAHHLTNVLAAGAAADDFIGALTADDHHETLVDHGLIRRVMPPGSHSRPCQVERPLSPG